MTDFSRWKPWCRLALPLPLPLLVFCGTAMAQEVAAPVSRTARSAIGQVGQRQDQAIINTRPLVRVESRIQNRVSSRIASRLDRNYDPRSGTAAYTSAAEQAGTQPR